MQSEGQYVTLNALDDVSLQMAMRYAEQAIALYRSEFFDPGQEPPFSRTDYLQPQLWFDTTAAQEGAQRAAVARMAVQPTEQAGMISAGFLAVTASGLAVDRPALEMSLYYPVTEVQYSLTVRDPQGLGSGWAGINQNDWARIDVAKLSGVALDKCLRSRNPVAIEPGRYTTILEPQAVYDFMNMIVNELDWMGSVASPNKPFHDANVEIQTKIGQQVLDERLNSRSVPIPWIRIWVLSHLMTMANRTVPRYGSNMESSNTWHTIADSPCNKAWVTRVY
jgi:hypothetical protein